MTLTLNAILAMAWRTVKNPREGAEEILSLGIPRQALGILLLLVIVLSIILGQLTEIVLMRGQGMFIGPIMAGVVQFLALGLIIAAVHVIGRAMGGTGTFPETVLLVAWLQFVMVCLQVIQTLAILILPGLAGLIGIVGFALFFWLLTNFVAVVHGFRSLPLVFVMILVSAFGIAFALSIVLVMSGVTVPMMGMQ